MLLTLLQIVGIVLVTLPLSIGATIAGQFRWTHGIFFGISRLWGRSLLRLARVTLTVHGSEHLKSGKSYVVVANHASLFDIPSLLAALPLNLCYVMKRELTRVPIWGWGLIRSPYIVIDRASLRDTRRSIAAADVRLRKWNDSVCYFPEGTRTRDGMLRPFKRGAFATAVSTGVSILPVTINGSFRILPKGKFQINPGRVTVVIGEPIGVHGAEIDDLVAHVEHVIAESYVNQS